ncbi:MAG: hypothetical protein HUJ30_05990 [Gammaproteobacteria bacterium]|nr:hypothetical protein [Gammaproteobacteria bacterium]
MYHRRGKESLLEIESIARPYQDAPLPIVLSDELNLILCYVVADAEAEEELASAASLYEEEPMLAVKFQTPLAHYLGPPDDEGLNKHPLAECGMQPYRIYVVEHSPWIETLREMQIRSGLYRASDWEPLKHYIFSFHSMTFECIAEGYRALMVRGPLRAVFDSYTEILDAV